MPGSAVFVCSRVVARHNQSQILAPCAAEHLAHAARLREGVKAEKNQHKRKNRHQIETYQSRRRLATIEEPFSERNMGAGKSQTQKGDRDQQLEEPLGVEKPKLQEAMWFAQVNTGQPAQTGELRPQAML